jgi:cytochrome c
MDDRTNTIAGWVLGAGIVALGATIVTGHMFKQERPEKMGYPIEGVVEEGGEGGAAVADKPIAFYLASADPAKGGDVFKKCGACHNADKGGAAQLGPNLWGVVGRPIASSPGFPYSDALKSKGGKWDWESLNQWLKKPGAFANGTKMTFAGLSKPEDRANVIAYLNKQSDAPLPMPAAPAADAAAAPADKSAAQAAPGVAPKQAVPNEADVAKQPKGNTGGEGVPAVAGRAGQTKTK